MGNLFIGINLEFVRHEDKPFEWGVEKAAAIGYTHVEPMVHWGRELLSEAGYSVLTAASAHEALSTCEQHQGDIRLVLTDVVLPDLSGLQLVESLASRGGPTNIVYMSVYTHAVSDRPANTIITEPGRP